MLPKTQMQRLCAELENGEVSKDSFLEACTRLVAKSMNCSRVGIWVFNRDSNDLFLTCLKMYDHKSDEFMFVPAGRDPNVASYVAALIHDGHVVASDVQAHGAIGEVFAASLKKYDVRSLLAAAFSVNGQLYGALSCTQIGSPMAWSAQQLQTVKSLGARSSLALHRHRTRSISIRYVTWSLVKCALFASTAFWSLFFHCAKS